MTILLWIHILGVAFWIGSLAYTVFILQGTLAQALEPINRIRILTPLLKKFLILVWVSVALLFVTGMEMAHNQIPDWMGAPTGTIFLIKMGLFALMGFVAVYITMGLYPKVNFIALDLQKSLEEKREEDMPSLLLERFPPLARRIAFWSRINLVLGIIVLFLAVKMVHG